MIDANERSVDHQSTSVSVTEKDKSYANGSLGLKSSVSQDPGGSVGLHPGLFCVQCWGCLLPHGGL